MDAEARIMPFFNRVHEVDAYMLDMEFQDCSYCNEGWFGIATGRDKSRLPGGFETQAFQKTNFCRAPEKIGWNQVALSVTIVCTRPRNVRRYTYPKNRFG
jgi:uncharacterized protein with PIN domain